MVSDGHVKKAVNYESKTLQMLMPACLVSHWVHRIRNRSKCTDSLKAFAINAWHQTFVEIWRLYACLSSFSQKVAVQAVLHLHMFPHTRLIAVFVQWCVWYFKDLDISRNQIFERLISWHFCSFIDRTTPSVGAFSNFDALRPKLRKTQRRGSRTWNKRSAEPWDAFGTDTA